MTSSSYSTQSTRPVLGPNKHGLVTYIQVNVSNIGNMLSWLDGGRAFKTDTC